MSKNGHLLTISQRLLWPTLPLVKEWPAQWLALLQEMDRDYMQEALKGVSVGRNVVHGDDLLFIHSAEPLEGHPRLTLARTKGEIKEGKVHW